MVHGAGKVAVHDHVAAVWCQQLVGVNYPDRPAKVIVANHALAVALLGATTMTRWIERPAMRWIRDQYRAHLARPS